MTVLFAFPNTEQQKRMRVRESTCDTQELPRLCSVTRTILRSVGSFWKKVVGRLRPRAGTLTSMTVSSGIAAHSAAAKCIAGIDIPHRSAVCTGMCDFEPRWLYSKSMTSCQGLDLWAKNRYNSFSHNECPSHTPSHARPVPLSILLIASGTIKLHHGR